MSSLLILDKTWPVVTGEETQLTQPTSIVDPRLANSGKPGKVEAYTKGSKDFKTKSLAWEDKNSRACALIRLNCAEGSGPRTHIHGMSDSCRMRKTLEKQYDALDLATLDLSL